MQAPCKTPNLILSIIFLIVVESRLKAFSMSSLGENVTASCTEIEENTGFEFSVDDDHKNNI